MAARAKNNEILSTACTTSDDDVPPDGQRTTAMVSSMANVAGAVGATRHRRVVHGNAVLLQNAARATWGGSSPLIHTCAGPSRAQSADVAPGLHTPSACATAFSTAADERLPCACAAPAGQWRSDVHSNEARVPASCRKSANASPSRAAYGISRGPRFAPQEAASDPSPAVVAGRTADRYCFPARRLPTTATPVNRYVHRRVDL